MSFNKGQMGGIFILETDEDGNVVGIEEETSSASEFKVEGTAGTALVTVKSGKDAQAVEEAIRKVLDSL